MTTRWLCTLAMLCAACGDSKKSGDSDATSTTTATTDAQSSDGDVPVIDDATTTGDDDATSPADVTVASDATLTNATDTTSDTTTCVTCGAYGDVLGAVCDLHARCPAVLYPVAYRDRAECMQVFGFVLTCKLDEYEDDHYRLVQNVPTVDPARASACVTWLQSADCDALSRAISGDDDDDDDAEPAPNPCNELLVAPDEDDDNDFAEGEACPYDDCRPGLYCTAATLTDDGAATCSVCKRLPESGQPCGKFGACAAGLYCTGDLCQPLVDDGATCEGSYECASDFCNPATHVCDPKGFVGDACTTNDDCRNRFCDDQLCARYRDNGEACTRPEQCNANVCDAGRCGKALGATCQYDSECADRCEGTTGYCVAAVALGDACSDDGDCASRFCSPFAVCDVRCEDDHDCGTNERCDFGWQICIPLAADDTFCERDDDCVSGYCRADETCGHPPEVGDSCTYSYECYPLGYCAGGTCQARKTYGSACDQLDECLEPMLCVDGSCQMMNLECRPALEGELCAWLRVCADGLRCDILGGFRCAPQLGQGEACLRAGDCQNGLQCAFDGGNKSCIPQGGQGADCDSDENCAAGFFCITEGPDEDTCQPGPSGQPCDATNTCPDGFFCGESQKCQRFSQVGEDCSFGGVCAPNLYCYGATCYARLGVGEECLYPRPGWCGAGLYCPYDNQCAPSGKLDEPCEPLEFACDPGLSCTYDQDLGEYRCRPGAAIGEYCYEDDQCASGVCDDDVGCVARRECVMPE